MNAKKLLAISSVILFSLGLSSCGGGGGDGGGSNTNTNDQQTTVTGTRTNPIILKTGVTNNVSMIGFMNVCGSMDLNCTRFDSDYVTLKFTLETAGAYKLSLTGVDSGRDLVVYIYKTQSPTSSVISYVDKVDDAGSGGSETTTSTFDASEVGNSYYFFLASWGGQDTIQAKLEKIL